MPILHAIVLGIVQGLSEFLPISSSGHLVLVPWLLDWEELTRNPELNRSFDVALHEGTFVGAFAYFRADVARLAGAALGSLRRRRVGTPDERLAWLLVAASLPAATVGLVLDSMFEGHFTGEWLVGVMLVVFGLVLYWADRRRAERDLDDIGLRDALLMGLAQASALQPGVSRSGATMSMGRFLGLDRAAAARMSFLMSLPITAGAGLYKFVDVMAEGGIPPGFGAPFLWGTLASAVTGFAAVWALLRLLRRMTLVPFVLYRVVVGVGVVVVAAVR